jgi:hypothetical protein
MMKKHKPIPSQMRTVSRTLETLESRKLLSAAGTAVQSSNQAGGSSRANQPQVTASSESTGSGSAVQNVATSQVEAQNQNQNVQQGQGSTNDTSTEQVSESESAATAAPTLTKNSTSTGSVEPLTIVTPAPAPLDLPGSNEAIGSSSIVDAALNVAPVSAPETHTTNPGGVEATPSPAAISAIFSDTPVAGAAIRAPVQALSAAGKSLASAEKVIANFFSSTRIGESVDAGRQALSSIASAIKSHDPAALMTAPAAALTPKALFILPTFREPITILTDSAAAFAKESALLGAAITPPNHDRAWIVTGTVATLDGILLMRVAHARKKRARAKKVTR